MRVGEDIEHPRVSVWRPGQYGKERTVYVEVSENITWLEEV